jgi:hypothetical protein
MKKLMIEQAVLDAVYTPYMKVEANNFLIIKEGDVECNFIHREVHGPADNIVWKQGYGHSSEKMVALEAMLSFKIKNNIVVGVSMHTEGDSLTVKDEALYLCENIGHSHPEGVSATPSELDWNNLKITHHLRDIKTNTFSLIYFEGDVYAFGFKKGTYKKFFYKLEVVDNGVSNKPLKEGKAIAIVQNNIIEPLKNNFEKYVEVILDNIPSTLCRSERRQILADYIGSLK